MNVRQFIKILRARQKRKSWFSRGLWVHSSGLIRITDFIWNKLQKVFKNSGNKLTKSVFSNHTSQMSISTSTKFSKCLHLTSKTFQYFFLIFFSSRKKSLFLIHFLNDTGGCRIVELASQKWIFSLFFFPSRRGRETKTYVYPKRYKKLPKREEKKKIH